MSKVNKDKHLVVISIDALVYEDLEYAKTLPNFRYLIENGAVIERVKSIYPTVTHPVHASIMTGCPAGETSVVSNLLYDETNPNKRMPWFNFIDQVKTETIFHVAKKNGLSTCAATWPLTCNGSDVIDYLVPNCFGEYFEGFDNPVDAFKNVGAQESILDIIDEGIKKYGYKEVYPDIDRFQIYCLCEIIKRYKPNISFTHPAMVDNERHHTGVFSDKVNFAIKEMDYLLGEIIKALKEAEIFDKTDIVFLSDHGQINITRVISPNVYLVRNNYITLDEESNITDYIAYCKSAGCSAQVYLNKKYNNKYYNEVYEFLKNMAYEGIYGFDSVYTIDEVKEKYGLYGDFSFVLETDGYTTFGEYLKMPAVRNYDFSDYRYGKATHGYLPEKGPQPTFVGCGPSFKNGYSVKECSMLDHASTFAQIFGFEFKNGKGKAVKGILKQ